MCGHPSSDLNFLLEEACVPVFSACGCNAGRKQMCLLGKCHVFYHLENLLLVQIDSLSTGRAEMRGVLVGLQD